MKETEAVDFNQENQWIIVTGDVISIVSVKLWVFKCLKGERMSTLTVLSKLMRNLLNSLWERNKFLWWVGERCSFAYIQRLVNVFRQKANLTEAVAAWTQEWQGKSWRGHFAVKIQPLVNRVKETYAVHLSFSWLFKSTV